MDTAGHLLIVELEGGREISRETVGVPVGGGVELVNLLTGLRINELICGAISFRLERMMAVSGIKPIPWVRGDVDEILAAYVSGMLNDGEYLLPGRRRHRQGRGRRCGRGMGYRRQYHTKEEQ